MNKVSLSNKMIIFLQSLFSIIYISYLLKFFPLKYVFNLLQKKKITSNHSCKSIADYCYLSNKRVSEFFGIKRCLTIYASLFFALKNKGLNPTLHIGINNDDNFSSHASVSYTHLTLPTNREV